MAVNAGLQLSNVPVLPGVPQYRLDIPENYAQDLKDIPVKMARDRADIAKSDLEYQQASGASKRAKNTNALMPQNASDIDASLISQYVQTFGKPPVDNVGQIDTAKVSDRIAKAQDTKRRILEEQANERGRKIESIVIDDEKGQPHRWLKIVDLDGKVVGEHDLGIDASEARKMQADQAKAAAGKPLTEQQANAVQFASRMKANNKVIDDLFANGFNPAPVNLKNIGNSLAPNMLKGEKFQQYDAAKQNWIAAVLRKESGAAISQSEFTGANKQYFPQVGDAPSVIAQKSRLRKLAEDAMTTSAGEQGRQAVSTLTAGHSLSSDSPAPVAPVSNGSAPVSNATNLQEGEKLFKNPDDPTKVIIQKLDGTQVVVTREQAAAMAQARAARRNAAQ
jgi:hypothetical protein